MQEGGVASQVPTPVIFVAAPVPDVLLMQQQHQ